jgi:hypothetical protein
MSRNNYPPGWDEERVRKVPEHYENQSDEEAVADDEAEASGWQLQARRAWGWLTSLLSGPAVMLWREP